MSPRGPNQLDRNSPTVLTGVPTFRGSAYLITGMSGVGELVAIGRLAEHLDDLLVVGGLLLGCGGIAAPAALAVGHHQTIGERGLRVDQLVAERHVAQLVREHRSFSRVGDRRSEDKQRRT